MTGLVLIAKIDFSAKIIVSLGGKLGNKFCTSKEINLELLGMVKSLILLIKTWEFLTPK